MLITKADGDSKTAADLARSDLERAISLTRSADEEKADVLISSAHANIGINEAWRKLETIFSSKASSGALHAKRRKQSREWLQQEIESELHDLLSSHPRYDETLKSIVARVESSGEHCGRAARGLVHSLLTLIP